MKTFILLALLFTIQVSGYEYIIDNGFGDEYVTVYPNYNASVRLSDVRMIFLNNTDLKIFPNLLFECTEGGSRFGNWMDKHVTTCDEIRRNFLISFRNVGDGWRCVPPDSFTSITNIEKCDVQCAGYKNIGDRDKIITNCIYKITVIFSNKIVTWSTVHISIMGASAFILFFMLLLGHPKESIECDGLCSFYCVIGCVLLYMGWCVMVNIVIGIGGASISEDKRDLYFGLVGTTGSLFTLCIITCILMFTYD